MIRAAAAIACAFWITPVLAGPPIGSGSCQCRAQNKAYNQGETVCLKMPQGLQLVQCVRDLNVTSWKKIQDGCPQAQSMPRLPSHPSTRVQG
jgi:hypothetical protein